MISAGAHALAAVTGNDAKRRRLQHDAVAAVTERQAEQRRPLGGSQQLLGLFDRRALFEDLPKTEGIGHALAIENRRAVAGKEHFVHGQGQPSIVHARQATEEARKADAHEGVLPLRPLHRDKAVFVEQSEGIEIEVAAEQRALGGAPLGVDHERRAGEAAPIHVGQRIGQDAHVRIEARLAGEAAHLVAIIGRKPLDQDLARLQVFRQPLFVVGPLQQQTGIVGQFLHHVLGETPFWRPISSGVPATVNTGRSLMYRSWAAPQRPSRNGRVSSPRAAEAAKTKRASSRRTVFRGRKSI